MSTGMQVALDVTSRLRGFGGVLQAARSVRGLQDQTDRARQSIRRLESQLERIRKHREIAIRVSVAGGAALAAGGAVAAGVAAIGKMAVGSSSELQNFGIQLETVTGSAEGARRALDWSRSFAAKTPFELPAIIESYTALTNFGTDAPKVLGTVGDAAAAMNADITEATRALNAAAFGEMDSLKRFGISAAQQGKSVRFAWRHAGQQMSREIPNQQGAIVDAITGIWASKFGGGMNRLSQSFKGAWSNLGDWMWSAKATVGEPIRDLITNDIRQLLGWLERLEESGQLGKVFDGLAQGLVRFYEAVKRTTMWVARLMEPFVRFAAEHPDFTAGMIGVAGGVTAFAIAAGGALLTAGLLSAAFLKVAEASKMMHLQVLKARVSTAGISAVETAANFGGMLRRPFSRGGALALKMQGRARVADALSAARGLPGRMAALPGRALGAARAAGGAALDSVRVVPRLIGSLSRGVVALVPRVGMLKGAFGGLLGFLKGGLYAIIGAFGAINWWLVLIAVGVGVLATAWYKNWGGIREKTMAVVDFLGRGFWVLVGVARLVGEGIAEIFGWVFDKVGGWWTKVAKFLFDQASYIINFWAKFFSKAPGMGGKSPAWLENLKETLALLEQKGRSGIDIRVDGLGDKVKGLAGKVKEQIAGVVGAPAIGDLAAAGAGGAGMIAPQVTAYYVTQTFDRDSVNIRTQQIDAGSFRSLVGRVFREEAERA